MGKDTTTSEQDPRIKKEISKLRRIFKDLDPTSKRLAENILKNAAFMAVTMEDLQEEIARTGPVVEYQNGANQWGTKKSPEVEIYNTMIRNYAAVIKQLADLLPDDKPNQDAAKLLDFISRKRQGA